jgi:hypothetical protein
MSGRFIKAAFVRQAVAPRQRHAGYRARRVMSETNILNTRGSL